MAKKAPSRSDALGTNSIVAVCWAQIEKKKKTSLTKEGNSQEERPAF